jgi:hypothetical protein
VLVEDTKEAVLGKRLGEDIVHPGLEVRVDVLCEVSAGERGRGRRRARGYNIGGPEGAQV